MKKIKLVLKMLGYTCIAYVLYEVGSNGTLSTNMSINEVLYNAGLSAVRLKIGSIGLTLLLVSEIVSLINNK